MAELPSLAQLGCCAAAGTAAGTGTPPPQGDGDDLPKDEEACTAELERVKRLLSSMELRRRVLEVQLEAFRRERALLREALEKDLVR